MLAMFRCSSHHCWSFVGGVLLLAVSAVAVSKPPPSEPSKTTKLVQPVGAEEDPVDVTFPVANVRLFSTKQAADTAADVKTISAKLDSLSERIDAMKEPVARMRLALAAVNLILSEGIEGACSRRLNGLELGSSEREKASRLLDRADSLLAMAGKIESELQLSAGDTPPKDAVSLSRNLETIGAFSGALRTYLVPHTDEQAAKEARRATSALSPLLEHDNAAVAAAATLWQAHLRSRSADPSRAMATLPLALTRPETGGMPYAFFTRMLRCKLVAKRGGTTTALAMLMQMEDRCDDWFVTTVERQSALRTVMLAEVQILEQWHKRLVDFKDTQKRDWCATRARRITQDHFDETAGMLLRCTPTIPVIVPIPERRTPDGLLDPPAPSN